jgi:mannitol/fructose-specific phosphotransferase system IIA component
MQTVIHTPHKVIEAYHNVIDGTIVIVRQYPSGMAYGNGNPVPDRIVKETYGVTKEGIALIQTQEGQHKPGYYVPESVEFPT